MIPMTLAWRPDAVHVVDPGIAPHLRWASAEVVALGLIAGMTRATTVVSLLEPKTAAFDFWRSFKVDTIESNWLIPTARQSARVNTIGRRIRVFIPGLREGGDAATRAIIEALEFLREHDDVEVFVESSRPTLDRRSVAAAERAVAFGQAVGSRLHLNADPFASYDSALLAGLPIEDALRWSRKLAIPLVLAEEHSRFQGGLTDLVAEVGHRRLKPDVPKLAWVRVGLGAASRRESVEQVWSEIEQSAGDHMLTDNMTNRISRAYSTGKSPEKSTVAVVSRPS